MIFGRSKRLKKQLDAYFRMELIIEAKKIIPLPAYIQVIHEVGKQFNISVILMGDFAGVPLGHISEYKTYIAKLKDYKITNREELTEKEKIQRYSHEKSYRDVDLLLYGNYSDKEDLCILFNDELMNHLADSKYADNLPNVFDLRMECIYLESELKKILEKDCIEKAIKHKKCLVDILLKDRGVIVYNSTESQKLKYLIGKHQKTIKIPKTLHEHLLNTYILYVNGLLELNLGLELKKLIQENQHRTQELIEHPN